MIIPIVTKVKRPITIFMAEAMASSSKALEEKQSYRREQRIKYILYTATKFVSHQK